MYQYLGLSIFRCLRNISQPHLLIVLCQSKSSAYLTHYALLVLRYWWVQLVCGTRCVRWYMCQYARLIRVLLSKWMEDYGKSPIVPRQVFVQKFILYRGLTENWCKYKRDKIAVTTVFLWTLDQEPNVVSLMKSGLVSTNEHDP